MIPTLDLSHIHSNREKHKKDYTIIPNSNRSNYSINDWGSHTGSVIDFDVYERTRDKISPPKSVAKSKEVQAATENMKEVKEVAEQVSEVTVSEPVKNSENKTVKIQPKNRNLQKRMIDHTLDKHLNYSMVLNIGS